MDNYVPRKIMSGEDCEDYMLLLHRELASIAKNYDPPNPFRGLISHDESLEIVVNDTNDLHWLIAFYEEKIIDGDASHVILADPNSYGYRFDTLDKMCDDRKVPCYYVKNKDWIIFMLNTKDNEKLILKDGKLAVIQYNE